MSQESGANFMNALQSAFQRVAAWLIAVALLAAGSSHANSRQVATATDLAETTPKLELVITGPDAVPLPRKDWRPVFTAVLTNRSNEVIVFVPPRNDWYGERRLEWHAVDSVGRWLSRQPNYAIECVHGVMRAVPDLPGPLLTAVPPRQIADADLVVLQPGESYQLKSLADPWFALNFRRHAEYTLTLRFSLASEHYQLPKNSRFTEALKKSSALEVASNELKLGIR
jgi:hypothetical protein